MLGNWDIDTLKALLMNKPSPDEGPLYTILEEGGTDIKSLTSITKALKQRGLQVSLLPTHPIKIWVHIFGIIYLGVV